MHLIKILSVLLVFVTFNVKANEAINWLNKEIDIIEKPDVSIIDPPRSGLHPKALKNIVDLNQKKIIYISCNPATQARDLKEIVKYGYKINKIKPIDMFPHTPHIETVVTLVNERS